MTKRKTKGASPKGHQTNTLFALKDDLNTTPELAQHLANNLADSEQVKYVQSNNISVSVPADDSKSAVVNQGIDSISDRSAMSTSPTPTPSEQNAALSDALLRAKQIAAKLKANPPSAADIPAPTLMEIPPDEVTRKRGAESFDLDSFMGLNPDAKKRQHENSITNMFKPFVKSGAGDDAISEARKNAMQVAEKLSQIQDLGSMQVKEMFIPNRLVGLVVGRGGVMINNIQAATKAKVQVSPDPSPELQHLDRLLTVTGPPENVQKVKDILDFVTAEGKLPDILNITHGEFTAEMLVPKSKVGLLIGKGGDTIRGLQEKAGCKMVLIQDGVYANSTEKSLRITGDEGACELGKQMVIALLGSENTVENLPSGPKSAPRKALPAALSSNFMFSSSSNVGDECHIHDEGISTVEYPIAIKDVGVVIGKSGDTIRLIQQQAGCKVQFRSKTEEPNPGPTKPAILTGTDDTIAKAKAIIDETIAKHRAAKTSGGRPSIGGSAGGDAAKKQGPKHGGELGPLLPGQRVYEIKVEVRMTGMVIGKGGESLRQIHVDSGAAIELNETVPDEAPFRVFTMQGSESQIRHAEQLIRKKCKDPNLNAFPVGSAPAGPDISYPKAATTSYPGAGATPGASVGGPPVGAPWGQQQPPSVSAWGQQQTPWGGPPQPPQPPQQPQMQMPWQQGQFPGAPWQQQGNPSASSKQTSILGNPSASSKQTSILGMPGGQPTNVPPPPSIGPDGQPDYSAQWAAYYQQYFTQYGMAHPNAPNANASAASTAPSHSQLSQSVQSNKQSNGPVKPAAPTPAPSQAPAASNGQPDYSAQWAAYYAQYYPGFNPQTAAAMLGGGQSK